MKNFSCRSILVAALAFIVCIGCGTASQQSGAESQDPGDDTAGEFAISTKALEVVPSITASSLAPAVASKSVVVSEDEAPAEAWGPGTPAHEVFSLLREYQYPRDEGVIDVSNIGKLLFEAEQQYQQAQRTVAELAAPTAIASPFDFGTEPRVFTSASDRHASAEEDGVVDALLTWIWDRDAPTMAYGVIEGDFNESTGDLDLEMAYLVDYVGDDDFSLRTRIAGNIDTHHFTLKMARHSTSADGYVVSLVGAGVSQSADEDDYFLLKIIDNGSLADAPEGRFFKVPASPTEDDLRGLPATGMSREELDDPEGYADAIDALTPFALDGSDNPTSVEAFSNAGLTLEF